MMERLRANVRKVTMDRVVSMVEDNLSSFSSFCEGVMTSKKTKKRSEELIGRRVMGIKVMSGGRALPQAYLIYEERYVDGTHKLVRGNSIHTVESSGLLNASRKKDKEYYKAEFAPQLLSVIQAAAILNQTIESACITLDAKRGLKEF